MKKILFLISLPLLLAGCRAHLPVAQQGGKENMAYLLFVSDKTYAGQTVQVSLDENTTFDAQVVKQRKAARRGTQYGVGTGVRRMKVMSGGRVIYQKNLYLSSQEVKQIVLP